LSARILSAVDQLPALWQEPAGDLPVVERVAQWVYSEWYAVPDPTPVEPTGWQPSSLVSVLRASLAAATGWQRGWVATQASPQGGCVAGRPNGSRQFLPGDFVKLSRPGLAPMPGDAVAVTRRLDWVDRPSGFWTAHSPAGKPEHGLVRLYWSVGAQNAGAVLHRLTTTLDASGARYMLKCPARAAGYDRVDTLVLYLDRERWPRVRPAMVRVARASHALLRSATPPLTQVLAPGLAFAEDPGRDESFGQSRCRALASGALALAAARPPRADDGVPFLTDALRSAAIDPDRPWLSAAS
jgi:hypothetical protein